MASAILLPLTGLHGGTDADELRPRSPDALGHGAAMALGAHALLIVALAFGVSWKRSTPEGIEAELWAAVPQAAAPRVEPPPPSPEPKPEPKPMPPAVVKPPPPPDTSEADIAREKRKKQLELEKQKAAENAEQKKRELAEKQRLEKAAAEKQRQAEAAEAARIEKQRQENLKRMAAAVAGTGAPDSSGAAAQSAGPSAGYAGRIKARIKPNIVFNSDDVDGNPLASIEVRTAPDGRIIGRRLLKSSGSKAWDDAVLRALDKTEMLPRDTDGRVPSSLVIDFKPRDL